MSANSDDGVSVIHNRFSLTLLNPASHYFSLVVSLVTSVAISATIHVVYLPGSEQLLTSTLAVVAVLLLTQMLDTRFTPKKEYSKSLHSSLFASLLWISALLAGSAASLVLGSELTSFFIILGMFLFASFRIGIYTTTLGVSMRRAWAICMVQPMAMFLVLVPHDLWIQMLTDPVSLGYGASFMIIATVWSHLTDIAGRPGMESTHKTIQAYLASQGDDYGAAEQIMEQRAKEAKISTAQIRLVPQGGAANGGDGAGGSGDGNNDSIGGSGSSGSSGSSEFRIVLPDIHPGPYHPVGGSNIPYLIYKNLSSSAMVMHSVSDHALNLPSRSEVKNYLKTLERHRITEEGLHCTAPLTVSINRARVLGIMFGRRPVLFLSLSPHGMEDVPSYVKTEIEQYAKSRQYTGVMVVDCHNAMGPSISDSDGQDMLKAAKSCLDNLVGQRMFPLEFGYANSDAMDIAVNDLGMGGLGVVCLRVDGRSYHIGWADANNMENGVREDIISHLASEGYEMLEICTSDTHFSRVKARNRNGYYQLGLVTPARQLAEWFEALASEAQRRTASASFEILENEAVIRVMGSGIFDDYSKALENSLRITKYFALGGVALFVTSLFL